MLQRTEGNNKENTSIANEGTQEENSEQEVLTRRWTWKKNKNKKEKKRRRAEHHALYILG